VWSYFVSTYTKEFSMSLNSFACTDVTRSNGNLKPAAPRLARLLTPVIEREQRAMLTSDDMQMAYVGFSYDPKFPALEQRAREDNPEFPAVPGRLAWVNGSYMYQPDTVVSYKRGRKLVTEWHALARVGQH